MTNRRTPTRPRRSRGFSMLEVTVAVALFGVFAALSVPMVSRTMRRNELRKTARTVQAAVQRARSLAISGKRSSTTWASDQRAVNAGVRVTATDRFEVFIDKNSVADGDEVAVSTVVMPRSMVIDAPAVGTELRFRADGTTAVPVDFVVRDMELRQTKGITTTAGGIVRLQ